MYYDVILMELDRQWTRCRSALELMASISRLAQTHSSWGGHIRFNSQTIEPTESQLPKHCGQLTSAQRGTMNTQPRTAHFLSQSLTFNQKATKLSETWSCLQNTASHQNLLLPMLRPSLLLFFPVPTPSFPELAIKLGERPRGAENRAKPFPALSCTPGCTAAGSAPWGSAAPC